MCMYIYIIIYILRNMYIHVSCLSGCQEVLTIRDVGQADRATGGVFNLGKPTCRSLRGFVYQLLAF
jgi:hypothetical protein